MNKKSQGRNLGSVLLLFLFAAVMLAGCTKTVSLKSEEASPQVKQPTAQAPAAAVAPADDRAAREKALRDQALRDKAGKDDADRAAADKAAADKAAKDAAAKAAAAKAAKEAAAREAALLQTMQIPDSHFDFDKSNLKSADQLSLRLKAPEYIKNKGFKLVIEGHCDERGTVEYNLALGQRRADEAAKYLIDLGIEKERIRTISYGKEKPLDAGHTEEAWTKNRRNHYVVQPPVK